MSSSSQKKSGVTIPDELQKQFPNLIKLILSSESMNDEERQYWINILPIMTKEQIDNLQGILDNELKQLKAIDEKYAKKVKEIGNEEEIVKTEHKRKERRQERKSKEEESEKSEESEMDDVLSNIENL